MREVPGTEMQKKDVVDEWDYEDRKIKIHDGAARQNGILDRLSMEVAKLRKDDQFVFWNSSYGYQVNDRSGDELLDYRDEAICTYDKDPRQRSPTTSSAASSRAPIPTR